MNDEILGVGCDSCVSRRDFLGRVAFVAGAIIAAGLGVAAVRVNATTLIALGTACTHEDTKVNIIGQIFDCPNHGARFASNGDVTTARPRARSRSARWPTTRTSRR
jgi:hypothetical protein